MANRNVPPLADCSADNPALVKGKVEKGLFFPFFERALHLRQEFRLFPDRVR